MNFIYLTFNVILDNKLNLIIKWIELETLCLIISINSRYFFVLLEGILKQYIGNLNNDKE